MKEIHILQEVQTSDEYLAAGYVVTTIDLDTLEKLEWLSHESRKVGSNYQDRFGTVYHNFKISVISCLDTRFIDVLPDELYDKYLEDMDNGKAVIISDEEEKTLWELDSEFRFWDYKHTVSQEGSIKVYVSPKHFSAEMWYELPFIDELKTKLNGKLVQ